MGAIKLGQTRGHPNTPIGCKAFYKPALGKVVLRKPGVLRRSTKVLARNEEIRKSPPASKCAGKDWEGFTACLSAQMS